jgi:nickel-dependent lactate racemase
MISSNAFDRESNILIGYSSRDTPIEINRQAYECDLHITIGKTQLHGMAGFSGGRKSVLPGIASYKSILQNHSPQMISDPKTIRGKLEDNPFHIEMLEAAELYRVDFNISFVVNDLNEPSAIFTGDLVQSHNASVEFLMKYVNVKLPEKPDIFIVTPGKPFNQNFYQASRAMRQLDHVIDKNTVVAFYAGCPEGLQSKVMMLPFENTSSLDEAEKWMWDNWDAQMDDTLFFIKTLRTGAKFLCYSPGVDRKCFEMMYCTSCDSYDEFISTAYTLSGKKNPRVMFYPMCQQYFTSC